MDKRFISREELAERWAVSTRSVINYEQSGVITRNPNIPVPRYALSEIIKLEGEELNPLSPLEKRKLERRIIRLENENELLKKQLQKFAILGTESISLLSY